MIRNYKVLSLSAVVLLCLIIIIPCGTSTETTLSAAECKLTAVSSQLFMASQMIETARNTLPTGLKDLYTNKTRVPKPVDCSDVFLDGNRKDGVYQVWPQSRISDGPLDVYCHMETDGGGWTVIQRRGDYDSPQDYFNRDWNAYKTGFGHLLKDFWIGNDNIFALSNQRAYQIKFDLRDWEQNYTYATYDEFWIDDELHNYTLHVKGYRGTAGDSFSGHNGFKFTTRDRDNDNYENNCAVSFKGAWWYTACHASNLNGYYLKGKHESYADGVEWSSLKGQYYSLKDTVMKIRPINFEKELSLKQKPE